MKKSTTISTAALVRASHMIDATGKPLGRLATHIATLLRGKNKPTYMPHIDAGDFVVVANAKDIKLTGKKADQKVYHHYSGYPGGLKTKKIADVLAKRPDAVISEAVKQMLPRTKLRNNMMKRLTFKD